VGKIEPGTLPQPKNRFHFSVFGAFSDVDLDFPEPERFFDPLKASNEAFHELGFQIFASTPAFDHNAVES
jgi:hypothetical protein